MMQNIKKIINNKPYILLFLAIILCSIFLISNITPSAGKIVDEKVVYSDKINNVSVINTQEIIELKTVNDKLNTVIITKDMYNDIKNKDKFYNQTLELYLKEDIGEDEIYNIKNAINLKIVNNKTRLRDYYVKVTGFKNMNSFLRFLEDAFKLVEVDKK